MRFTSGAWSQTGSSCESAKWPKIPHSMPQCETLCILRSTFYAYEIDQSFGFTDYDLNHRHGPTASATPSLGEPTLITPSVSNFFHIVMDCQSC